MTKRHHYFSTALPGPYHGGSVGGREVHYVVHDDDDYVPPFFLSYPHEAKSLARAGKMAGPDEFVEQFFNLLGLNVSQMVALRADEPPGFMDRRMRGGMQWADELLRAVGRCQVLVALLSAQYLRSNWCKREWNAFAQRDIRPVPGIRPSPRQGCIIPVVWAPFHGELPPHISPVQIFSPDRELAPETPDHYEKNGVFGLMQMSHLREFYEIFTWQLAMHIAHIFHSQLTEPRDYDASDLDAFPGGESHD